MYIYSIYFLYYHTTQKSKALKVAHLIHKLLTTQRVNYD
ncbi:hypothetical protein MNB_SV-14-1509 [hydrothermal vent metagenome]|uniref:Uncharacterized protein n=1 Tax=hydrothermal vent metagenome TaxID=652676 RepID=A0A1W1CDV6_9ZZZZ